MSTRDPALKKWLSRLPGIEAVPFDVDRSGLYRISDLYQGYKPRQPASWKQVFDHRVYEWTLLDPSSSDPELRPLEAYEAVAERLHDTAIGFAINKFLAQAIQRWKKPVIGFMGGHDTDRNDVAFTNVANIARTLRQQGFSIVSGGGPGLMEAANFGAFMAGYSDEQFDDTLSTLAKDPHASDHEKWVLSACEVRAKLLGRWNAREKPESESLGIPTWYYGNEPPNLFASHTGKYFFNSVREDGLVTIASGGIVFGPGSAGTVQEIFQDTPLNYYRKKEVRATPMVLLGVDFWNPPPNETGGPAKPAWPLLTTLSQQAHEKFRDALKLTDDPKEVIDFIEKSHTNATVSTPDWTNRSERFRGRAVAVL